MCSGLYRNRRGLLGGVGKCGIIILSGAGFSNAETVTAMSIEAREQALQYFQRAYELQMKGELDEAIALYRKSIEACPTGEAYTFLGWTYSFQGRYEEAIRECNRAIEVDPDFGNPYNDIGAYLIEMGRPGEAIPWLEKAVRSSRYESYFFPYFNMGRAYERLGQLDKASECQKDALALNPRYAAAAMALAQLRERVN